ncbi:MAG: putative secreted protein [uncultured Blastococcus sp.]|uniref:Putative secreted protein n=1 Tax=uncultured Blastococcus sp. TaxID=217144 RepID=A0A6J4GY73_9ACTN|nr:MAG: putative secreted protein [uncultured Blastococcus sp.]
MTRRGAGWALARRSALQATLLVTLLAGCGTATPDVSASPGSTPPGTATAAPSSAVPSSSPVRVRVPAIGVDSELMELGLQDDGSLEVPPAGFPAGWYTGAPMPGEIGPAVMAGHVDWNGSPGVFYDLRSLVAGDEITVTREDGSTVSFAVVSVEQFAKEAFPTEAVYGDLDHPGLRLITCGGSFDPSERSYTDNIVVFAELVGAAPG